MLCKSIDWFLYEGNAGSWWVNVRHEFFVNFFPFHRYWIEQARLKYVEFFKSQYIQREITQLHAMRSVANVIFKCHNPKGIKFLTRLRLRLSHLHQYKYKHSFQDTLNPVCRYSNDIETTIHNLLQFSNYSNERLTLLNRWTDHGLLTVKFRNFDSLSNTPF